MAVFNKLFRFLVRRLLLAVLAELLQLEALLSNFLVLIGLIIQIMADRAFHVDKMILGHSAVIKLKVIKL